MYIWAPQFSVVRAPPVATLVSSFHFITSLLWAPPVATQFSVLSQTFVKVQAPPVANLLFHLISSHHFSGHHLWRPLSYHFIASFLWAPPWLLLSESRVIALIPARGGSVYIPKNNVAQLFGRPLIDLVISPALDSGIFAEVYIHTHMGLSGPLWDSLGLSGPLWASLGLSGRLWSQPSA